MKLLLFECLVGGGQWIDGGEPNQSGSLMQQGKAMLLSLAHDLVRSGVEVVLPVDARLLATGFDAPTSSRVEVVPVDLLWEEAQPPRGGLPAARLRECLLTAVGRCDGIVLIAPESDGCLSECCCWFDAVREKLICPDSSFVKLAADKQATCEWLTERGVRVPKGDRLNDFRVTDQTKFPLVLKPILGAGSEGLQLIHDRDQLPVSELGKPLRIEECVSGRSVSVSVLCGPGGNCFLPATGQIFDAEPFGNYVDTEFPLPPDMAARARRLAEQTMNALPSTRGYIGIDMILSRESHELDCVIEVNPRLTMSYPRLSQICEFNLGEKMVSMARAAQPTCG
jgi:predicted ATP-grasp superfamily ATP-dependent carboligase